MLSPTSTPSSVLEYASTSTVAGPPTTVGTAAGDDPAPPDEPTGSGTAPGARQPLGAKDVPADLHALIYGPVTGLEWEAAPPPPAAAHQRWGRVQGLLLSPKGKGAHARPSAQWPPWPPLAPRPSAEGQGPWPPLAPRPSAEGQGPSPPRAASPATQWTSVVPPGRSPVVRWGSPSLRDLRERLSAPQKRGSGSGTATPESGRPSAELGPRRPHPLLLRHLRAQAQSPPRHEAGDRRRPGASEGPQAEPELRAASFRRVAAQRRLQSPNARQRIRNPLSREASWKKGS